MIAWIVYIAMLVSLTAWSSCKKEQAHETLDDAYELVHDINEGNYGEIVEDVVDLFELDLDVTHTPKVIYSCDKPHKIDMEKVDPDELKEMKTKEHDVQS